MSERRDSMDDADDGRNPIDPDRMLRSIERLRMVPPALLILATIIAVTAMIYWLVRR
jgi:hypothetical protein